MPGVPDCASVPHSGAFVKTIFMAAPLLSVVLAIEQVAHRLPAGLVCFRLGLAFLGVQSSLAAVGDRFGSAALRTAIRETGLVRLQLELFFTNDADFDGKDHFLSILRLYDALSEEAYRPARRF